MNNASRLTRSDCIHGAWHKVRWGDLPSNSIGHIEQIYDDDNNDDNDDDDEERKKKKTEEQIERNVKAYTADAKNANKNFAIFVGARTSASSSNR